MIQIEEQMKAEIENERPRVKKLVRYIYIIFCKPSFIANLIKYAKPF